MISSLLMYANILHTDRKDKLSDSYLRTQLIKVVILVIQ